MFALIDAAIFEISLSFNYSSSRRSRDSAELTLDGALHGFTLPTSEPPPSLDLISPLCPTLPLSFLARIPLTSLTCRAWLFKS